MYSAEMLVQSKVTVDSGTAPTAQTSGGVLVMDTLPKRTYRVVPQ
jgi:hypothetical protein